MIKYLLQSLALVIIFSINVKGQVPSYVPSSNLEGWWAFDGNANDASGTGNHFTNNGASLVSDRFSNANSAFDFNGSNQYLLLSNPSFSFGQASSFSVSFWLQASSNAYGVALMNGSGVNGNFIWNFQIGATGNFQFGTNKQGSAWYWAADSYTPPLWEHFVGTYDNGTMILYKNGVQVTTTVNMHTGVGQGTHPFYIGRGFNGAYFDGMIDDIGVWSRVLTASEVSSLYNGCSVINGQPNDQGAAIGANSKIGISASSPGSTYQWQIENSGTFQDILNTGQYSGANSDSLLISNLSLANNGCIFRCIIEGASPCADTSQTAQLFVCDKISQQPRDTIVSSSATGQFSVQTGDPNATYQWQSDLGTGYFDIFNGGQYAGANSSTLTVSNLVIANSGQHFRCILNPGICADTSTVAELTVAFVGLEENGKNKSLISIYPNPASDILFLDIDPSLAKDSYSILNNSAQIIKTGRLEDLQLGLDLSKFSAGYYVLKVAEIRKPFIVKD